MSEDKLQFLIPTRLAVDSLKGRLLRSFPLTDEGQNARRRHFFDTFDWRLYRHQLTLEEEQTDHGKRLVMRDLATGAVQRWVDNVEMPRFAADLVRGPFRDRLLELTAMRALLPVAEIRSHGHQLRLRDREEKTVARIEVELAALNGDAQVRRLPKRLHILPVRGHGKPARMLTRYAAEQLELPQAQTSLLDDALAATGRKAANYTNTPHIELDPEEPAEQALRRILLRQLDTMEVNVPGTCQYIDTEYLHDLRVAVRRTRSLLSQFPSVFPEEQLAPFRQEFGWLGTVTGPCRDLDVHLLGFDGYQAQLKLAMQPALEPLRRYLVRQHSIEQHRLNAWLHSPRFRALMTNWRAYLSEPRQDMADGSQPIKELADKNIWALYRKVSKRGRKIGKKTPAARLHRLRIHCKKLRYLIEFFRDFYPVKRIAPLISRLKTLQRNLGEFHDYCIQAETLQHIGEVIDNQKLAGPETSTAINALTKKLEKQQRRARNEFAGIFAEFDRPASNKKARRLFRRERR
ncbi:MAG: CHAD domain-containing protein [Gammaproteobacteria bacterium]|nr:CHAD domain-containing protein [Gammaproteobacteria bacterium]